jgi:hypothetical protein
MPLSDILNSSISGRFHNWSLADYNDAEYIVKTRIDKLCRLHRRLRNEAAFRVSFDDAAYIVRKHINELRRLLRQIGKEADFRVMLINDENRAVQGQPSESQVLPLAG